MTLRVPHWARLMLPIYCLTVPISISQIHCAVQAAGPSASHGDVTTSQFDAKAEAEIQRQQALIEQEIAKQVKYKTEQHDRSVERINADMQAELSQSPGRSSDWAFGYHDPGFASRSQEAIRARAANRVAAADYELERFKASLENDCRQRIKSLRQTALHTRMDLQSKRGSILQTPQGTSMYVHNYVNFGEDAQMPPAPVVPLRATPMSRSAITPAGNANSARYKTSEHAAKPVSTNAHGSRH